MSGGKHQITLEPKNHKSLVDLADTMPLRPSIARLANVLLWEAMRPAMKASKKSKKAFTLIEILVLISITAIILALVLPAFCKHPKQLPEEPAPSRFTITAEHSTSEFQAIYLIKDTKTSNEWLYLECRTVNKPVISLIPK